MFVAVNTFVSAVVTSAKRSATSGLWCFVLPVGISTPSDLRLDVLRFGTAELHRLGLVEVSIAVSAKVSAHGLWCFVRVVLPIDTVRILRYFRCDAKNAINFVRIFNGAVIAVEVSTML